MQAVTKILIERTNGTNTILILKKPLLFSHFIAFKYHLKQNPNFIKNYKTFKPIWKD